MKRIRIALVLFSIALWISGCRFSAKLNSTTGQKANMDTSYWVENGVTLVSGGDKIFEDSNGIYDPVLSSDANYIAYSNGGGVLYLYSLSGGKSKEIYKAESADYAVYAVGWSKDSKRVALITSNTGGFIGGNELITVDISDGKANSLYKKLGSADWGKDGRFIIADSSDVKILDENGKVLKTLGTPQMNAFFSASNPAFSPDGSSVVYNCGKSYYLHDLSKDTYTKLFELKADGGTARIGSDGKILVSDSGRLMVYDGSLHTYYEDAESTYPNWC